jgi:Xaa-Pro aminopeptidase
MITNVDKLTLIRAALKQHNLDAYLITIADPHLDEEIPDHWKIIQWLTGFTGSAATVVITDSFAGLWTDSRYFIQAGNQLQGSGFELVKPEILQDYNYADWLRENLKSGSKVGMDGRIWSIHQLRKLEASLQDKKVTIDFSQDPVSDIWIDRPVLPDGAAFDHPLKFAGKDRSVKINEVREQMKKMSLDYHLLTAPDDIMWLLNIRGNDLEHSPLLNSFAIIGHKQILLFAEEEKIPLDLKPAFDILDIVIFPYDETEGMLSTLEKKSTILLSPEKTSVAIYNAIPDAIKKVEDISIPSRLKAVKNKTEIENICKTMVRDGVAMAKFFHFVEENTGILPMTEVSLTVKLCEFRSMQPDFICPSFSSIVAYNEHGALPHYTPSNESDVMIGKNGILLVDSGGQYQGGTTDITRTVSIGTPSPQQKTDFTLVLKGYINLATVKFPLSTRGYQLDILARKALWEYGLNYGHGTGHGVGYCLNVHEGPQNISPSENRTRIEPGMLISNEPSVYREDEYGIRTENLMICYEDEETDFGQFLKFDTVSLCYIDKKLIDKSLLDRKEIEWLNSYHSEVFDKISPFLNDHEKEWLKEKTDPL